MWPESWTSEEEDPISSKLQHCWDQPECWEESRWLEGTCSHSDSSERPSVNAGVKTPQEYKISNDKHQGCPPGKILGTILEMNEGKTSINGPEAKKADDDAQSLTSETCKT